MGADSLRPTTLLLLVTLAASAGAVSTTESSEVDIYALPEGWIFASATSAYQVEGAWNVSDKGPSIWDTYSHDELTENGDDACKSYYLYERDVEMVATTGFNAYRFSISWPRVLPYGINNYTSSVGVQYYHDLLDELAVYNITPLVTLYHWDLPQALEDMGGWLNSSIADWFEDYADLCFSEYGSKVKYWITFNEPDMICDGYSSTSKAPGNINEPGIADYVANHNILRSHAKAYHLYNSTYKPLYNGSVGMTFNIPGVSPVNSSSAEDREATQRAWAWNLGVYANPVYSIDGNYPSIVREKVNNNSYYLENRTESRLPSFTAEELDSLKGAYDFIGVNHYSSIGVTTSSSSASATDPSMSGDSEVGSGFSTLSGGDGLRVVLNYIKDMYNNPTIMITETGTNTNSAGLYDTDRISTYHSMILGTLKAIYYDGCNVVGFTGWSLMDNYEWGTYDSKYGIWQVDFDDDNRTRTMKESGYWFQVMLSTWRLPDEDELGAWTTTESAQN